MNLIKPSVPVGDVIYQEQLKLLFKALPFALLATVFNSALLTILLWEVLPHQLLLTWYAVLLLVSLARYIHYRYFKNRIANFPSHEHQKLEKQFLLGVISSALLWGLLPVVMYPQDIVHQTFVTFVFGGMCAGAVTSLSYRLTPIRLYLLITLLPLIVRLLSDMTSIMIAMGLMVIMFMLLLLATAKRLYENTLQNISLRLESYQREIELTANINALQDLHSVTSNTELSFEEKMTSLLQLGLKTFQMDIAIVSHIVGDNYTIEYIAGPPEAPVKGTQFNFSNTYCAQTFYASTPKGFNHVSQSALATHPCYQAFGLEAYLGTTLWVDNRRYGTLNFSSALPREKAFSKHELALIQLFAQWIGNEISRSESERKLSQFKSTLDMTRDCVFMFDPTSLRFIYVNQGAVEQVGYTYDELMKMTPFDLKPEFNNFDFFRMIRPLETGEQSMLTFETIISHKNGNQVPVEISLQYVTPPNASPRYVALLRDITERRRIDKIKNEFVSTVSHELRTPLTSIRGALGLISSGTCGDIPEKAQPMLEIANNNTRRLLLLINDILDLQKIESGNMDFHFTRMGVIPFVEQAINDNLGYANEHQVSLVLDNDISQGDIYADRERLMQVMNNLLSNAIKFSPEQARVEVSVSRIADYLRITVTDHGPGIPESFHNELFERFTQFDSSDTRQTGGTGLGLSISKVIVEKHNGHIDFSSSPGHGSSFYIELQEMPAESDQ